MTVAWMLGALAVGALLGIAALAAERIAAWFRLPRRWIWATALAGSVLLPALALAAPGVFSHLRVPRIGAPPRSRAARVPSPVTPPRVAAPADGISLPSRSIPPLLGVVLWSAASLATAGALGWSQRRLRAACGALVPGGVDGTPVLVAERAGPLVIGVLRPRIVLPRWAAAAAAADRRLIVAHEREHVRAGDPWLLALAAAAVAAMPWSPALWWQHRRLRLAVETDCDARVLALGAGRGEYGRVLLRTASHPFALPTLALAWGGNPSHLERRIMAMTESHPRRRVLRTLPLAAFAVAVALAACTVASGTRRGSTVPVPTVTREIWQGREVVTTDNHDGTESISMGPDPAIQASTGTTGFSYNYHNAPLQVPPVAPRPMYDVYPVVDEVAPGSPAETAGLMAGDVILSANGIDGRDVPLMPGRRPGTAYTLHVRRGSAELDLHLVLRARAAADHA
jgi:hypothetical protein